MAEAAGPLILVVEDELIVREIVCQDLIDAGYRVIEADSGDAAYDLLGDGRVAAAVRLLFTDIRMPGALDGWALAERARALMPELGVVYASGYVTDLARAVPGSLFLSKPYRTAKLIETIRSLLPA